MTPNVVFDASSIVGALLKAGSVPERALLHARARARLCLSPDTERELRAVLLRPKFVRALAPGRAERMLELIVSGALWFVPTTPVADCRDRRDDIYLELALAASAEVIVSSDADLLVLHPWRGIPILRPADYLARVSAADDR